MAGLSHSAKLKEIRLECYKFLEHPHQTVNFCYQMAIFLLILLIVVAGDLLEAEEAVDKGADHSSWWHTALMSLHFGLTIFLLVEYIIRVWAAGAAAKHRTLYGRIMFMCQFACLIDVVVLLGAAPLPFLPLNHHLQFLLVLRIIRVDGKGQAWKSLEKTIVMHRRELFTAYSLGLFFLLMLTAAVYICESSGKDEDVITYAETLWWGVITITTVGYGDFAPKQPMSKMLTASLGLVCVWLYGMAATIMGVGLTLMVQANEQGRHKRKQRVIAVRVLQCAFRLYLLENKFHSIDYYRNRMCKKMRAYELFGEELPVSQTNSQQPTRKNTIFGSALSLLPLLPGNRNRSTSSVAVDVQVHDEVSVSTPFERQFSLSRPNLSIPKRERSQSQSALNVSNIFKRKPTATPSIKISVVDDHQVQRDNFAFAPSQSQSNFGLEVPQMGRKRSNSVLSNIFNELPDNDYELLLRRYKNGLIGLYHIKFMLMKRRFKRSRQPYDVQDISNEVNESECKQLGKLKEVESDLDKLFGRNECVMDQQNDNLVQNHESTLIGRLETLEERINGLDQKAVLVQKLIDELFMSARDRFN